MTLSDLSLLTVNVFPGGFNWGVYVGQDKGFFADAGIAVEIQDTPNSVTQMTDFSLGKFDIAMTAVDNIVAYAEGQGEAPCAGALSSPRRGSVQDNRCAKRCTSYAQNYRK